MSARLDWRGATIGDHRPQRPWERRVWAWLVKPSTSRWLAPIAACVAVLIIFALFIGVAR